MPNWRRFQQDGFARTELEIEAIEAEVIQIYRDALRSIEDDLRRAYSRLAGVDPADAGYYNALIRTGRLDGLLRAVNDNYRRYARQSGRSIASASRVGIVNNYYRQLYAAQWAADVSFSAIPDDLVELAVFGTESAFREYRRRNERLYGPPGVYQPAYGTLSRVLQRNDDVQARRIRETIIQGLIRGDSFTKSVDAIRQHTGREIVRGGARTLTGSKAQAIRIIRTERTRILNAGSYARSRYLESQGIEVMKRWVATLDTRLRDAHSRLDGVTIPVDERFQVDGDSALYPGNFSQVSLNVNCRCTTIDILPGFEPLVRRGRNPVTGRNEVFSYQDFPEWASQNNLVRTRSGGLVVQT